MEAAVFLDRDNTIIANDGDLGDPDAVVLMQGVASAIASLRGLGYRVVVVSNQGGVARGKYTEADVDNVHARISELIEHNSGARIDRYYYCPFHPEGAVEKYTREHPWRKPSPGMLQQAAKDMDLDLPRCWMIGDQLRDIEAGKQAGVRTVLLHPEAAERPPLDASGSPQFADHPKVSAQGVTPDFMARNLIDAVKIVAQQRKPWGADEVRGVATQRAVRPISTSRRKPAPTAATEPSGKTAPPPDAADTASAVAQAQAPPAPPAAQPPAGPPAASAEKDSPTEDADAGRSVSPSSATSPRPSRGPQNFATAEQTLRQILQELRNQRRMPGDLSFADLVAMVLMVIAAICLLTGLWLGQGEWQVFLRWSLSAIVVGMTAIGVLLLRR